jgi:hypothetical protein
MKYVHWRSPIGQLMLYPINPHCPLCASGFLVLIFVDDESDVMRCHRGCGEDFSLEFSEVDYRKFPEIFYSGNITW